MVQKKYCLTFETPGEMKQKNLKPRRFYKHSKELWKKN